MSNVTPMDNAKSCVMFYYEKITGTNLYGTYPHPSVWNTKPYIKAIEHAVMNLADLNKSDEIREIYKNLIP